jgi:hypothetical protein
MNSRASEQYGRVVHELNEERAAALRRIATTLQALIDELHALAGHVAQASDAERPRAIERYRIVRRHAVRYRWYLEVQREALGLRQHHRLDEFYRIPDSIER